jgi:HNH endonuclease
MSRTAKPFDHYVEQLPNGCREWRGSRRASNGYGRYWHDGRMVTAHRYAYERQHGAIPAGLEIDHTCRNRACVNPAHMEVVTHRENVLRGDGMAARRARRTHCPKGHPYDMVERDGRRRCRRCYLERKRAADRRRRAA